MNLKELFSAHDMTVGAPWQRIMEFTVPMLIGNLAQQLYNTADSIVVGHYIGDNALAAVGSAGPILNLLLALFVGVATGAGIVISQNYGAGRRDKLSESVGNCITLAAIASAVTTVIGLLLTTPMLRMLDTPESILSWSAGYLHIIFWGVAGGAFYNILSGILRGLGDSVSALLFLLVATGLNIAQHHRLKTFGQFPAQGNPALSQDPVQFLQCSYQMVGRLVKYYGAALLGQFLQNRRFIPFLRRQESFKAKAPGRQPRKRQGSDTGRRTGQTGDGYALFQTHAHQHFPRIGDGGSPRVRDQRHILPRQQSFRQQLRLLHLVIFMIAGHGGMDVKMIQ